MKNMLLEHAFLLPKLDQMYHHIQVVQKRKKWPSGKVSTFFVDQLQEHF
jgi:hypothetical protein